MIEIELLKYIDEFTRFSSYGKREDGCIWVHVNELKEKFPLGCIISCEKKRYIESDGVNYNWGEWSKEAAESYKLTELGKQKIKFENLK
jgi:hypothetical protein